MSAPAGLRAAEAPPVEVAVGVVFRTDGAVLLGQRVPGKPYAGWWEFPGGKLERGETVARALARELDEELGLVVHASSPWIVREFTYPHARVRLHFHRVTAFSGEPRSREGQAFAWLRPDAIDVAPLLPATVPVIAWLRLPPALCRSAAASLGDDAFVAALQRRLAQRRVPALLLDEPALAPERFESLFHRVLPACRAHGVRLLAGPSHAPSFGRAADGRLLPQAGIDPGGGRPAGVLVGAAAADVLGLQWAAAAGLDFAVLDADAAGLRAAAPEGAPLPVYLRAAAGDAAAARAAAGNVAAAPSDGGAGAERQAGAQGVVHGAAFWQDR